jgi:3-dehydroquinate synthase
MQNISFSQLIQNIESHDHFIIDQAVFKLYESELSSLKSKKVFFVVEPEVSKNINVFNSILESFLEMGITRGDTIVAIGGGATTDLAGFVASTILRGVDWISVPTTLLAMVDASIGGKVGINSIQGKNLIGNFHLPIDTLFCFNFLNTLDNSELESGKGEILKYCFLDKSIKDSCLKTGYTNDLIFDCAKFKIKIVKEDFKETGKRAMLNFGHTFGHVVEKLSGVPHGLAVAKGIEVNLKAFSPELLEEFHNLCSTLEIKIPLDLKLNLKSFLEIIKLDKKNKSNSEIGFIYIEDKIPTLIHLDENTLIKKLEENEIQNDLF